MSRSQRVGKLGEDIFRLWATENHLSATKPEFDMGIDFLCQVLAPVAGSRSLEGIGAIFGAQIKTVESGSHSRFPLRRRDAIDLLRQTQATGIFGVELDMKTIFFRFFDEDLMDQLQQFLLSKNASWSLPYAKMSSDASSFGRQLLYHVNPNTQSRLRLRRANQRLVEAIPGSAFTLNTSTEGMTAHIAVPKVSQAYQVAPDSIGSARLQVFERGYLDPSMEGVTLHPEINRIVEETLSQALVLIGVTGEGAEIRIKHGQDEASTKFEIREFGDELSLVHKAGFRLTYSAARKDEEGYVHHLEHDLFGPDAEFAWEESSLSFFKLLQPGAELVMPNGNVWQLQMFGEALATIGPAVDASQKICKALELDTRFDLIDLKDEEFACALSFLNALFFADVTIDRMVPAFVFGPAALIPPATLKTKRAQIELPIVVNWKDTGLLIWVTGEADAFRYKKQVCGFRITKQTDWKISKREHLEKSVYPEAWFYSDWPAIQLKPTPTGSHDFTYDGSQRLFEAKVRVDK